MPSNGNRSKHDPWMEPGNRLRFLICFQRQVLGLQRCEPACRDLIEQIQISVVSAGGITASVRQSISKAERKRCVLTILLIEDRIDCTRLCQAAVRQRLFAGTVGGAAAPPKIPTDRIEIIGGAALDRGKAILRPNGPDAVFQLRLASDAGKDDRSGCVCKLDALRRVRCRDRRAAPSDQEVPH